MGILEELNDGIKIRRIDLGCTRQRFVHQHFKTSVMECFAGAFGYRATILLRTNQILAGRSAKRRIYQGNQKLP